MITSLAVAIAVASWGAWAAGDVTSSKAATIVGLVCDIAGVIILVLGVARPQADPEGKVGGQVPGPERWFDERRSDAMAGLVLVAAGFAGQLVGAFLQA
jgi:hypothetical protein